MRLLLWLILLPSLASAQEFTVVSLNMWQSGTRGFNALTHQLLPASPARLSGFEAFLRRTVPSGHGLVGLQEVDDGARRSGGIDVAQCLDQAMGPGWANRFGGVLPYQGGRYGNALLTNVRIRKTQYWTFAHDPNNASDYGREPRGAVACKLDFGGKSLWFITTHLDPVNAVALRQAWQLMGCLKTLDPDVPVIVVGDFNIRNRPPRTGNPERTYAHLAAVFDAAASGFVDVSRNLSTAVEAPLTTTNGQLDYIFLYDPHSRLRLLRCQAAWVTAPRYVLSDHKALVARFRWK